MRSEVVAPERCLIFVILFRYCSVRTGSVINPPMRGHLFAFVVGTMVSLSAPALANLLVDGGFENPVPTGTAQSYDVGASIGAWSVVGTGNPLHSVALIQNGYSEEGGTLAFTAYEGVQSLDLTGASWRGYNGVSQTVATNVGTAYELRFHVGNQTSNSINYPLASAIEVLVDGTSMGSFVNGDNDVADLNWKEFSLTFNAASTSTTIAFMNVTGSADNMAGLDAVSLVEAPEPTSAALLFGGLISAATAARRRSVRR